MAIQFVASAIPAGNPTTSFTITIPTVQVGDLLLLACTNKGATTTPDVIDNDGGTWTRKTSGTSNGGLWYRYATSATSGKTISAGTVTAFTSSCTGVLVVLRGTVGTGDPFNAYSLEDNIAGNETHAQITPTIAGCWIGLAVHVLDNEGVTSSAVTNPGALTEGNEKLSTGGTDCATSLMGLRQGAATATGAATWSQVDVAGVSQLFAVTPLPETTAAWCGVFARPPYRKALTTAVLAATSGFAWNPQVIEPPAEEEASPAAFVSNWAGPTFSRQFQYQSVSAPVGTVETVSLAWQAPFEPPVVKVRRTHLANGTTFVPPQEDAAADPSSGAFTSPWAGPAVSRQFQYQSIARPVREPDPDPVADTPFGWFTSFAPLPEGGGFEVVSESVYFVVPVEITIGWHTEWKPPARRKPFAELYRSANFVGLPVADPEVEASSGAFVSPWSGPAVSRQFQYQSVSRPVGLPEADPAGAETPSDFDFHAPFAEPVRRKRAEHGSIANVFVPVPEPWGWHVAFGEPTRRKVQAPPTWPGWSREPDALAATGTDFDFHTAFARVPTAARSKTPWLWPSVNYTPGQTDGGTATPVAEEPTGGGWLSPDQVKKLKRKQRREREAEERRLQDKLRAERAFTKTIEQAYAAATEGPVTAVTAVTPPAKVIAKPVANDSYEDIKQQLEEIERAELEDDEEAIAALLEAMLRDE
jgi:hypothetical protein